MSIRHIVKPKVERLLKENPALRSSDKKLLMAFWRMEGLDLTDDQFEILMQATPAESITRSRRALRDKYPGTDEVEKERYTKYIEVRDEMGNSYMKEIIG